MGQMPPQLAQGDVDAQFGPNISMFPSSLHRSSPQETSMFSLEPTPVVPSSRSSTDLSPRSINEQNSIESGLNNSDSLLAVTNHTNSLSTQSAQPLAGTAYPYAAAVITSSDVRAARAPATDLKSIETHAIMELQPPQTRAA